MLYIDRSPPAINGHAPSTPSVACPVADYVNFYYRCIRGRVPKRNKALQAFYAAKLLKDPSSGITTMVAAAAVTSSTLPMVRAATEILESGDPKLAFAVLRGQEPLLRTAAGIRNRVRLIKSFRSASVEDRAAFGRAVGVATVFDGVVAPSL